MQQLLPSILASTAVALLLGAAVIWLLHRRPDERPLPTEWTLTARAVFSSDERRVYGQLREALPHHVVLSKLPLLRFCQPTDPQAARFWYSLLASSHVSFAVCSINGRVLAALDLEPEKQSSRRSVQIKQAVLAACRVRYLRCPSDHLPSVAELQLLVPHSGAAARGPQPAPTVSRVEETATAGSPRRLRRALWQDSRSMQDSFYGLDGLDGGDSGPASGFGLLRLDAAVRSAPAHVPAAEEPAGRRAASFGR